MTPRVTTLVNDIADQAGWFAVVVGAALGHGDVGAALAAALISLHLWLTRERGVELGLLALATFTGVAVETWPLQAGTYRTWSRSAGPRHWRCAHGAPGDRPTPQPRAIVCRGRGRAARVWTDA